MHTMTMLAAPLTDGADLKEWVLLVVGNLFAAWLAVRAFRHFVKDDWGGMITMSVGAVFVAGLVWFPAQAQGMLEGIWGMVAGTA